MVNMMKNVLELRKMVELNCYRTIENNDYEVVYRVTKDELSDLSRRIADKVERNAVEREASEKLAAAYVVH